VGAEIHTAWGSGAARWGPASGGSVLRLDGSRTRKVTSLNFMPFTEEGPDATSSISAGYSLNHKKKIMELKYIGYLGELDLVNK